MEMINHVSSSIELIIASDDTNSEIFNEIIYIDGMGECYCATYVYIIMIV